MKSIIKAFCLSMILCIGFSSCVSTQKYDELKVVKNHFKVKADSLQQLNSENTYATNDVAKLQDELKAANYINAEIKVRFEQQDEYIDDLESRYDELLDQNKLLLDNSSLDLHSSNKQLSKCQSDLDVSSREIRRLKNTIASLKAQLNEAENIEIPVAENCDSYREQVANLNNMVIAKDQAMNALRAKVNTALTDFKASGLSITESNGKVYVSLSQELLFATGSDKIDWKGKKALQKLATVLQNNPQTKIMVEGHTDSSGSADKNWDLSVRRATAVTKVLVANKVNPKRITAAGRGLYDPIASNGTSQGKAKNRRTDIILTPNLDDLYTLVKK